MEQVQKILTFYDFLIFRSSKFIKRTAHTNGTLTYEKIVTYEMLKS